MFSSCAGLELQETDSRSAGMKRLMVMKVRLEMERLGVRAA